MSQNKGYRIKKKLMTDTFAVPRKLISKLAGASEAELKIFLVLASLENTNDYFTKEEIAAELEKAGISSEDIAEGMAYLRGAELVDISSKRSEKPKPEPKEEEKPAEEPEITAEPVHKIPSSKPSYTSMQLAEAAKNKKFKSLVEWASGRLGKTFNTSEVAMLYSFKDYLCLPYDVIMLGIEHCVSEGKPSLRYAEKLLIDFADREINTYPKAEEYILKRKSYLSFEGKIRSLMGLGQRSLTSKEKAMLSRWQEWQMPDELIRLAYEKTVEKTGKASMSYMHKILESWHSAGFRSLSEVEKGDAKPDSSRWTFNPDDFLKVAVESTKNN